MNLIPLNKNSVALIIVTCLACGFFISGLLKILDYFIIKALLFTGFGTLVILAFWHGFKNDVKKNRPEENPKDDSY